MKPLSQRTISRILAAANEVETTTNREAAILGAIVASLTTRWRFDMNYIQHHTAASLDWAKGIELTAPRITITDGTGSGMFGTGNTPDASKPSESEVKAITTMFRDKYQGPPEEVAA